VFDKLKQAVRHRAEQADEMRAHPGPADLAALPAGTARLGGLDAIPLDVVCGYVGLEVAAIRPLDRLGPETSSLIADKIRQRMRDAGVGEPGLEPGELVAGQNAARLARMRAQGMSEEQIAMIQQRIGEVTAEHQQRGWTIELTNGDRASVVVASIDDEHSGFARLRGTYESQHTRAGTHDVQRHITELWVHRIDDAPYETYGLPGKVSARGRTHDVDVAASHLGTLDLERTLVAFACLALHALDG